MDRPSLLPVEPICGQINGLSLQVFAAVADDNPDLTEPVNVQGLDVRPLGLVQHPYLPEGFLRHGLSKSLDAHPPALVIDYSILLALSLETQSFP